MNRRLVQPSRVLSVGLACVDFVNQVRQFPNEDSDKRGSKYYWQRGGNATNISTVLTVLSRPCDFMGVLGTIGPEASWVVEDFENFGIPIHRCVFKECECPVATVILSQDTGTRTIIFHPRNVDREKPFLTHEDFACKLKGDFSQYSWIHFELTSNVVDVCRMLDSVTASQTSTATTNAKHGKSSRSLEECESVAEVSGDTGKRSDRSCDVHRPVVSVEVEKPEIANNEQAMSKADIVFISKDFAMSRGYSNGPKAVEGLYPLCRPGSLLVCAWGEKGASASFSSDTGGETTVVTVPALEDMTVCDTLGAGDTFIAGVIHNLMKEESDFRPYSRVTADVVEKALQYGCLVAGAKVGIYGYESITDFVQG